MNEDAYNYNYEITEVHFNFKHLERQKSSIFIYILFRQFSKYAFCKFN